MSMTDTPPPHEPEPERGPEPAVESGPRPEAESDEPFVEEGLSDAAPESEPEPETTSEAAPVCAPAPGLEDRDKRWVLARDVLVFQGKLALDALRDLVLSPVSIGAALFGIFNKRDNPGVYFYDLMRWGRRSDKFINLFSAGQDPEEQDNFPSVDDLVGTLEDVIVREHEKGGMTAEAKSHIDKTIDSLDDALDRDREKATRHIKAAAATMKREIKRAKDRITPPSPAGDAGGDEPPRPPGA